MRLLVVNHNRKLESEDGFDVILKIINTIKVDVKVINIQHQHQYLYQHQYLLLLSVTQYWINIYKDKIEM